jgi:hypothetical protein
MMHNKLLKQKAFSHRTRIGKNAYAPLALSLLLVSLLSASHGHAQVGPQPPQQRPPQDNQVTKALIRLLNKTKKTDGTKTTEGTPAPVGSTSSGTQQNNPQLPNVPTGGSNPNPSAVNTLQAPLPPEGGAPPFPEPETGHPPLLTQPPLTNVKVDDPQVDKANPPIMNHPKLDDPTNPLGFSDAEIKLKRYIGLVDAHRYTEARPGLLALRQSLVDLTEAHIGLYKSLNQLPSARGQAELEKELALQFAQLRDRAMMESARVFISDKEYIRAVKELSEVVKSQPRTRLGLRCYELLQEIGFTEKLQLTQ